MAPRTSQQFEQIRENRKNQIMETAMELFAEYGYENTSINQIAKKAGISKGLMYNYFESKDALLYEIFDTGIDEMISLFDLNKDGVLTREEFIYFIDEVFKLMENKRDFYKLYFNLVMQPTAWQKFEKKFNEILGPMINIMSDYFKRKGVENPMMEALMVGSLFDGIGFNYVYNPDMFPLDEIKKHIIKRLL